MGFNDRGAAQTVATPIGQPGATLTTFPLETYQIGGLLSVAGTFTDGAIHLLVDSPAPFPVLPTCYALKRVVFNGLPAGSAGLLSGETSGKLYSAVNPPGAPDNLGGLYCKEGLNATCYGYSGSDPWGVTLFYDLLVTPTLT